MDFLDPLYARRQLIRLYTGYILIAIAVLLGAALLLLVALGFNIGKNGEVVQNGLLFASTRPAGATVYLDGVTTQKQTNTRLNIPEGTYELELKRAGYRAWQHRVTVPGGMVIRYDYPFLFPEELTTSTVKSYGTAAPGLVAATPDNHWLLVQPKPSEASFDMFDLTRPTVAPTKLTIPTSLYAAGGKQSWHFIAWADDKDHVLLRHGYGTKGATEFVLVDRQSPAKSLNLSAQFGVTPTEVSLIGGKYDQYYLYFAKDHSLQKATLSQPQPVAYLTKVLEYQPYKSDGMLYVTPTTGNDNRVDVRLRRGDTTYSVRQIPTTKQYEIAISDYSGDLYVAVSVPTSKLVYMYKNPTAQVAGVSTAPVPVASLPIAAPNHLTFSVGGRFFVAEHGTHFATYDAEYLQRNQYTMSQPIDAGQSSATWMDGAHLQYVSNGQLLIFDYDGANPQLLVSATANASVYYDTDWKHVYCLALSAPQGKAKTRSYTLNSTALRVPADM